MIPSVDTYVYTKIKDILQVILKQPRILEESLALIDKEARENFIKTFGGLNPKKDIGVSYAFPGVKERFDARIVVQMGEGIRQQGSIGMVEGTFTTRETGDKVETTFIKEAPGRLYIETTQTIGDVSGIDNIEFSKHDDVRIEGNRIYFNKIGNESLVGLEVTVYYTSKEDLNKDPKGIQKGYTSDDIVEVTPLSNNIDTARCLDALMKVILIIMYEDIGEKTTYGLQTAEFSPMQNVIPEGTLDSPIFGRPLTLKYTVSYYVDFDITKEIKAIMVKGVEKFGKEKR